MPAPEARKGRGPAPGSARALGGGAARPRGSPRQVLLEGAVLPEAGGTAVHVTRDQRAALDAARAHRGGPDRLGRAARALPGRKGADRAHRCNGRDRRRRASRARWTLRRRRVCRSPDGLWRRLGHRPCGWSGCIHTVPGGAVGAARCCWARDARRRSVRGIVRRAARRIAQRLVRRHDPAEAIGRARQAAHVRVQLEEVRRHAEEWAANRGT